MPGVKRKYPTVDALPKGALTIRNYCIRENLVTATGAYNRWERGQIRIIEFQGIKFVVPGNK